jgi:hypothetical protein
MNVGVLHDEAGDVDSSVGELIARRLEIFDDAVVDDREAGGSVPMHVAAHPERRGWPARMSAV